MSSVFSSSVLVKALNYFINKLMEKDKLTKQEQYDLWDALIQVEEKDLVKLEAAINLLGDDPYEQTIALIVDSKILIGTALLSTLKKFAPIILSILSKRVENNSQTHLYLTIIGYAFIDKGDTKYVLNTYPVLDVKCQLQNGNSVFEFYHNGVVCVLGTSEKVFESLCLKCVSSYENVADFISDAKKTGLQVIQL